jgi:curved DNA-binding protein CbpA
MKQPSKYFDSIRIAGNKRARPEPRSAAPSAGAPCEWKGCKSPGAHKAPKGRGRDGEYFLFCVEHVRQYNATYNYFDGMSDTEVEDFRRDSLTGHRPTRKLGANAAASAPSASEHGLGHSGTTDTSGTAARFKDPHAFFAERARAAREEAKSARRKLKPLEKKSLQALNLPDTATKEEIKSRYKELVKEHHPDANGGDSRSADKLREVIQAYNLLKSAGMV